MIYQTLPLNTPAIAVLPDREITSTVLYALREAGYAPRVVNNGLEAIRNLTVFQPNLVILDLFSSDNSSKELLDILRSDINFPRPWVIVIMNDDEPVLSIHKVADVVLMKPVSFAQLRDLAIRFRRSPA